MPLLSKEQYLATFDQTPQQITDESPSFDFWPYFASIPVEDFEGHDCSAGMVEYVWRIILEKFEHVLISSENKNIFMVSVLDQQQNLVYGHKILNLEREYGLNESDSG